MKARTRWLCAVGLASALLLSGHSRAAAQAVAVEGALEQGAPAPAFGGAPTFIPYDEAPVLLNREDVRHSLALHYPQALRLAGTGGTVLLWLLVDENGELMSARVKRPSGQPAYDAAALRVAAVMRFDPGRYKGAPVKVWVAVPIIFATASGSASAWPTPVAQNPRANAFGVGTPKFPDDVAVTQPTSPPSLLNGTYVFKQLKTAYEKRFGTTGERGSTKLRLHVDISGNATTAEVGSSSGNAALDSLALSFRERLVFVPAISRGRYAEGTTELEMRFPVKEP